MKPARNPYDFDEALERAGLPTWEEIFALPDEYPLRRWSYQAWLLVQALRSRVGVPEAAILAAADGRYTELSAAHRLGGDAAALALLAPYVEKLRAAQEHPYE